MKGRDDAMRILIAYEDSHRSYGQTLAGAIRGLRPVVETAVVQVRELEAEVGRFDPHLVVCNRPNTFDLGGRLAWLRLSDEPEEPSEFCLAGRRWGSSKRRRSYSGRDAPSGAVRLRHPPLFTEARRRGVLRS